MDEILHHLRNPEMIDPLANTSPKWPSTVFQRNFSFPELGGWGCCGLWLRDCGHGGRRRRGRLPERHDPANPAGAQAEKLKPRLEKGITSLLCRDCRVCLWCLCEKLPLKSLHNSNPIRFRSNSKLEGCQETTPVLDPSCAVPFFAVERGCLRVPDLRGDPFLHLRHAFLGVWQIVSSRSF